MTLPDLSGLAVVESGRDDFLAAYGHLFEHSLWVVERTWERRPFVDAAALHAALLQTLTMAGEAERLALVRAHPRLADKLAIASGELSASSQAEQAGAGLDRLSPEEYALFHELNQAYEARFGFPFIVAVKLHDRAGILAGMRRRLASEPADELTEALVQIGHISRIRLAQVRP